MSDFRNKTIVGVSWSVVSQVGRQGLAFIVGVVLMRLLSKREFGLLAMVTIITRFGIIFAELGFGAALIQKKEITREHLSSIFWVNIGSGALLTGLFMLGAPLIAAFYDEPLLVPLTIVVATTFFIRSLGIIQRTLFTRAIDFKALSIAEISSVLVGGIIAIWMAAEGWGVWSLAARLIVAAAVLTGLLWLMSPWRPALTFRWGAVKELIGFSASLLGTKSMNYWVRHLDDLLIGKFFGKGGLGLYHQAYRLMLFPLRNVSRVISRVLFPSLSSIQDDKLRVKRVFLRMARTIALITFPLMAGLFATTESFVLAVFGEQWAGMIPILRVFCILGITQSIGTLMGSLFLSQGRADWQFKLGLFIKPLLVAGIVIGLQWGVIGVAVGYAIASLLAHYPTWHFAGSLVELSYREQLRNVAGVFACATVMAALVYGLGYLLPPGWSHAAQLAVQVPFGVIVYLALIHFSGLSAYREARALITEQRRRLQRARA